MTIRTVQIYRSFAELHLSRRIFQACLWITAVVMFGFSNLVLGDCIETGGSELCSRPQPLPWSYNACDLRDYAGEIYNWCAAAGNPGCANSSAVNFPTDGSVYTVSQQYESIIHGHCAAPSGTDSGWGQTISDPVVAGLCWSGGPTYSMGNLTRDFRSFSFSGMGGTPCTTPYTDPIYAIRSRSLNCSLGTASIIAMGGGNYSCSRIEDNTCSIGNPIQPGSGNKVFVETDFAIASSPLKLTRRYNSFGFWQPPDASAAPPGLLGDFWRTNYDSRVYRIAGSSYAVAAIQRPDGKVKHFTSTGAEVHHFSGTPAEVLVPISGGGWTYTTGTDEIETYDASGRLIGIWDKTNLQQTLSYDSAGRLAQVIDAHGRALNFTYTGNVQSYSGGTITITTPDGARYVYTMDEKDNLLSVALPAAASRVYLYEDTAHANAITGIMDENGVRYETVEYDSNGHAAASYLAPNVAGGTIGRNRFTYSGNGSTTMVDPLGQSRTLVFTTTNGVMNLGSTTQPCSTCGGATLQSKTYDANGYPDLETDFNGTVTNHDYNARGLETQREEAFSVTGVSGTPPQRRTTQTDWHSTFRLPTEKRVYDAAMTLQTRSAWTYNARGQVLTKTEFDPIASHAARVWSYTYCEAANVSAGTCPLIGLLTQVDGPRSDVSDVTRYTYRAADDPTCASAGACTYRRGDLWKVTNGLGQVIETVSYDKNGRVTRTKDANGTLTDLGYHPRGWLLSRTVRANTDGSASALDATTVFAYDAVGNVTRVTQPDGAYLAYTYDDAHRLTDIADNLNNRIHYTLDAAGNRTVENTTDPSGALKRTLSRSYSTLNRLQQTTDALAHRSTFGYDANGNSTSSVDALNTETDQQYDPLNRLVRTLQDVTAPTGTSTRNTTTQYTYDARDNLTDVTDPDNLVTHYVYDGQNNLTQLQSPDTGTTGYTVDAAGNRISQTDARGITTSYTYDALNRLTGIRYPTASLNITFRYDEPNACAASYPQDRLTTTIDASGTTHYCYDRRGNLTRKQQTIAGITINTAWSYNLADRVTGMSYPSGLQLTYTRNAIGQITQVRYQAGSTGTSTSLLSNVTYLPFGPISALTFGNSSTLTKAYDQNYAIDRITSSITSGLTLDFSIDAVGNVQDASNAIGLSPPTQRYRYDDLYRLSEVDTGVSALIERYSYNKTGDRLAKIRPGQTNTYSYSSPLTSHRLRGINSQMRSFDANGNTLTNVNGTLSYDDANRLATLDQNASAMHQRYTYNGRGERTIKSGWDTISASIQPQTYYGYNDRGQLINEYRVPPAADCGGTTSSVVRNAAITSRCPAGTTGIIGPSYVPSVDYVYLDDTPIAVITWNLNSIDPANPSYAAKAYYVHTDHLNTPRAVIEPTRNVAIWAWDFFGSAFGENLPNQDPDADGVPFILNLRFSGQYYDQETGLNYNYFRNYEASTGRYLESDPIGLKGDINTYAYVLDNPLSRTDPKGLWLFSSSCDANQRTNITNALVDMFKHFTQQCSGALGSICSKCDCTGGNQAISFLSQARISCNLGWGCGSRNEPQQQVWLNPDVASGKKPKCGCLPSVLFHEGYHVTEAEEDEVRKQTRRCFGCGTEIKENGAPLKW